jgi:hypothetical protein
MSTLEIFNIVANIAAIVVAAYAVLQLQQLSKTYKDDHEWNRRNAAQAVTMELGKDISKFSELNQYLNFFQTVEPIPLKDMQGIFKQNPSLELKLIELLNVLNAIARGVFEGVYDESIIRQARQTTMFIFYDAFKAYIEDRKKTRGPDIYCSLECLVNKWRNENNPPQHRGLTGAN